MKKQVFTLLFVLITLNVIAKTKVILNPYYDVKTTGISSITKIELKNNETLMYLHCEFPPQWWLWFSKKTFIKDCASGDRLYATALIGGEFDKQLTVSASGYSDFVLVFPKLGKTVTDIDYGDDDKVSIFSISLDPNKNQKPAAVVPLEVQKWMDVELAKAKNESLVDYSSANFFRNDTAKLVGYIKGYDKRAGFTSGMIYAKNELTNEDSPIVISIQEDGRFTAAMPMNYPQFKSMSFSERWINFYIEPGQTLSMVLSWEDFLKADRMRDIRYKFTDIQFGGVASKINAELLSINLKEIDYRKLNEDAKKLAPNDFKSNQMSFWKASAEELEQKFKEYDFQPQTKTILRNEIIMANTTQFFDYVMNREYEVTKDTLNKILKIPVGLDYYAFLKEIPLDNQSLLISNDFSTFVNRFEFSTPFSKARNKPIKRPIRITFEQYLFDELALKPSAKDSEFIKLKKESETMFQQMSVIEKAALVENITKKSKAFEARYKTYNNAYILKYSGKMQEFTNGDHALNEWTLRDSILASDFKLESNLAYEISKVRSLKFYFEKMLTKDDARTFLTSFEKGITYPFLKQEAERMYNKAYPNIPKAAYDLPEGRGADIFRKIIEPYKGKIVFVDFWSIFCGPCIGSIKHNNPIRAKYKGSQDFDFVFITPEDESPLDKYTDFVKEQELVNTNRLNADDYRYLRQLFKFNGIPRYVVINKQGQVLDDNFQMHNFESELNKILAAK